MHLTAYENCYCFYEMYLEKMPKGLHVLEVGSMNVNGTLRPLFEENGHKYTGIDLEHGPNVDIIVSNIGEIPFADEEFDVVISSSNFEHDKWFWETFLEMCRITKRGGYIYINAPSDGPYHGFPGDAWRFYKDSWKYLAEWGQKKGFCVEVINSYIDSRSIWKDNVGVFRIK